MYRLSGIRHNIAPGSVAIIVVSRFVTINGGLQPETLVTSPSTSLMPKIKYLKCITVWRFNWLHFIGFDINIENEKYKCNQTRQIHSNSFVYSKDALYLIGFLILTINYRPSL